MWTPAASIAAAIAATGATAAVRESVCFLPWLLPVIRMWMPSSGRNRPVSPTVPALNFNDEGKGFDRMCDPTYTNAAGTPTDALPNAPISGHWFHDQFVMLVQNSYPVLPVSVSS